jgi:hypothetical protein
MELPTSGRLQRIVRSALHQAEQNWAAMIVGRLDFGTRQRLRGLVDKVDDDDVRGKDSLLGLVKSVRGIWIPKTLELGHVRDHWDDSDIDELEALTLNANAAVEAQATSLLPRRSEPPHGCAKAGRHLAGTVEDGRRRPVRPHTCYRAQWRRTPNQCGIPIGDAPRHGVVVTDVR